MLEARDSIPTAGEKKIGDGTCFPYCHLQVSQVTEFDLGVKGLRSTKTHHLNRLQWAIVPNATFIVSRPLSHWFQGKKIFEDYLPYMVMAAMGTLVM